MLHLQRRKEFVISIVDGIAKHKQSLLTSKKIHKRRKDIF